MIWPIYILAGLPVLVAVLVIVWAIRRVQELPAERRGQMTSVLGKSIVVILGGLVIFLGLTSCVLSVFLIDSSLLALTLAGLILASTGLALAIIARGGARKRQVITGLVLILLALLFLAYPVLHLLMLGLLLLTGYTGH